MNKRVLENRTEYRDDSGKLHRTDGPAIEWNNGAKHWYEFGKRHRVDGPAEIMFNGTEHYYFDDKRITEEEFKLMGRKIKIKKIINNGNTR